VRYFYDKSKSNLSISDLQFPSATRGIAVGVIEEEKHERPVSLVTADAGAHWELVPLKETPLSLFFLNENLGWMVTDKGLWQTSEAGRSWRKLPSAPSGASRVFFVDESRGWAACAKKKVLATEDGGQHWKPVEAASQLPGDPRFSAYNWVVFATPTRGLITGWNLPPRRNEPELPGWIDPEAALKTRETPHLGYTMATDDAGHTWHPSSSSMFGVITRVRMLPSGFGLMLVEYGQSFPVPAEVYRISGTSNSVFKNRDFAISDLWLAPDGTAYLAGVQRQGRLGIVPGPVKVLRSTDYKTWPAIEVDYRAVAHRAVLASAAGRMWMATDAGMILALVP
jgi:hypothetical protein